MTIQSLILASILQVSVGNATLSSRPSLEAPVSLQVPIIVGKPGTPTLPGTYRLRKAYTSSGERILIYRETSTRMWSIHENLPSRRLALYSKIPSQRYLSRGCIGVDISTFNRLWSYPGTTTMIIVIER